MLCLLHEHNMGKFKNYTQKKVGLEQPESRLFQREKNVTETRTSNFG